MDFCTTSRNWKVIREKWLEIISQKPLVGFWKFRGESMLIYLNLQKNFRESSPTSQSCKMKAENHTCKLEDKEMLNPFWNGCKTGLPHVRLWTPSSHDASPHLLLQCLHLTRWLLDATLLPAWGPFIKVTGRCSMVPKARKCSSSRCRAALRSHRPRKVLPWPGRSIFQIWSCLQTWHPSVPKPNLVHTLASRISWISNFISHGDNTAVP